MDFKNPVFNPGINCTVRLGEKWKNELNIGGVLSFTTGEKARVKFLYVCRFSDLVDTDLFYEHDPKCTTCEGLWEVLKGVYPGIQQGSVVTVVYFEIIKGEEV